MRDLAILLLLALPAIAQVSGSLSMVPLADCRILLDKQMCGVVSVWVGAIQNDSAETVAVGPSAVLRQVAQLRPLSFQVAQLLAAQGQAQTWQSRLMGVLTGTGTAAASVSSSLLKNSAGIAKLLTSTQVAFWAAQFLLVEPTVARFIQGTQPAIAANFAMLAWSAPIQLQPGASATFHLFTSAWAQSQAPVMFTIDTSRLAAVKLAQ